MNVRKILVPTDFSPYARAALDRAIGLAAMFGADVDVLHVWSLPPVGISQRALWRSAAPPMDAPEYVRELAARQLDRLLGRIDVDGVYVEGRLEEGDAAEVIVDVAGRGRYDLVVLSTHGRTGLSRLFMGSVAERVVREAPCPVLVVRPTEVGEPRGLGG